MLMLTVLITSEAHTARSLQKFQPFLKHAAKHVAELCLLYQWTAARAVTHCTMPYSSRKQSWGIKEGHFFQYNRKSYDTLSQLSIHYSEILRKQVSSPAQWWGSGHIQRLLATSRGCLKQGSARACSHIVLCIHRQANTWWAALIFSSALGFHATLCKNCLFSLRLAWCLCPMQFRCFIFTAGAKRHLNFHYVQGIWPWFVLDDSFWHQMGQEEKCLTGIWKSLGYIQHQPWFPSYFTGTK